MAVFDEKSNLTTHALTPHALRTLAPLGHWFAREFLGCVAPGLHLGRALFPVCISLPTVVMLPSVKGAAVVAGSLVDRSA